MWFSAMLQEPTLGDVNAAKVHMSAPGNTNVYVGNLPVEVGNPVLMRSASCSPHVLQSCHLAVPLQLHRRYMTGVFSAAVYSLPMC